MVTGTKLVTITMLQTRSNPSSRTSPAIPQAKPSSLTAASSPSLLSYTLPTPTQSGKANAWRATVDGFGGSGARRSTLRPIPAPMNLPPPHSGVANAWRATDNGTWWLRSTPYLEETTGSHAPQPDGDYVGNCFLGTPWYASNSVASATDLTFNDWDCSHYASGNRYICSTNDFNNLPKLG